MSRSSLARNPSPSAFVTLSGVAARTPDGRTLFENLSLSLGRERTGIVGRNGTGKTTLLDLIAGDQAPAEGHIVRNGSIARLRQDAGAVPGQTVAAALGVEAAQARLARILAGDGTADDLAEADWTLEARLESALAAVGLGGLAPAREAATLSGGERTRLELAALELAGAELILLDEPTNHLDADGRALVAERLSRWPGGAVVVSHDRALLRQMDRIVELSPLGATVYGGNYDLYAERKAIERVAAEHDLAVAESEVARTAADAQRRAEGKARRDRAGRKKGMKGDMPKILRDFRAETAENSAGHDARLAARQAAEAEQTLVAARERVERVRRMTLPLPETGLAAGRQVLTLQGVRVDGERGLRVGPVDLRLTGAERVAITGPNGSGKTTLLDLIAGRIMPSAGTVECAVPLALLDQHAGLLRDDETLIEAWQRLNPDGTLNDAQAALARFLFRNVEAHKRVETLSGGERLRAALACVMTGTRPPQLLVLDEPTNHLDLDAIEAVEAALAAWDGALVVVSHDRDFLDAVGIEREIRL
ncbi:MAG: ABC transporter [Brevundimonas sp.]|uniref:ABC-F family ATP-binding cassette domain-containing protein n=1 Tax=unclassified Brevundimonas TaxID=2622653 RepID=UPI000C51E626|nr:MULTISPECIES: ABC-F family ATP-binding cassette domain-containing protein [unclassified Brevundimonas]MAL87273.1 ABC transporter [Brevundimonas sp.]